MAYTVQTTSGLSQELITYLSKDFLPRAKARIVFKEGVVEQTLPSNSGKTMSFDRMGVLDSTPGSHTLTEGTIPAGQSLSDTQVTATLVQYGDFTVISDFLNATSIDTQADQKVDVLAQQMAEVIDNVIRDEMFTGFTIQYANQKASLSALAATDVLSYAELQRALRTLDKAGTLPYDDGFYIGKIGADTAYDIMNDSKWINAKTYSDVKDLYNAEIGQLAGFRLVKANKNQKNEASTTTVYSNFFHGKGAIGTVELESMPGGLYISLGGKQDTSNPLNQYITIGWKIAFAAKTLNSAFGVNVKSGATA